MSASANIDFFTLGEGGVHLPSGQLRSLSGLPGIFILLPLDQGEIKSFQIPWITAFSFGTFFSGNLDFILLNSKSLSIADKKGFNASLFSIEKEHYISMARRERISSRNE